MPLVAGPVADLAQAPGVRACLEWFRRERAWINEHHLKLCRVPAPTFFEQKRAEWMADRFRALGWDAKMDRSGNVIASLPGRRDSASVAVTAHLDTVLAPRSPDDIKVSGDGRFLGPGVSDNGAGLSALLALAAAWTAAPPLENPPLAPILVANVGEEGEGNLCGMRYLCRNSNGARPKAFLVLDGPNTDHITSRALASRRFEVTIAGPGGHSWSDYGVGNPVHALCRAIADFTDAAVAQAPAEASPRWSFNFGLIQGGTSINCIPSEARAKADLRSESPERIDQMAALLATSVERAAENENDRATAGRVTARLKEIGSRPGGQLREGAAMLECVQSVDAFLGIRSHLDCSSTDANIPLSLGLPAISIGAGGTRRRSAYSGRMVSSRQPGGWAAQDLAGAVLAAFGGVTPSFIDSLWQRCYVSGMSMTSLNISLPSSLKEFVETQVQENGFSTPSEYIRSLVRDDQKRRAEEQLEILLLEGLNSGEPIEITPEYWEKKRTQLIERHAKKTAMR